VADRLSGAAGDGPSLLEEGWYLMSTEDLERELARWRGDRSQPPGDVVRISTEEALAYRNRGNLPDARGRSLRLVLTVADRHDLEELARRRLVWEPDYHSAPDWRREGSRAVNVVPLRRSGAPSTEVPWWEMPGVRELDAEWRKHGTVGGLETPAELRGFVYKTVLSLRAAGKEVTPDTVADSIARWLPPDEAEAVRAELKRAREG
jgi:hypothetical protein